VEELLNGLCVLGLDVQKHCIKLNIIPTFEQEEIECGVRAFSYSRELMIFPSFNDDLNITMEMYRSAV